MGAQLTCGARWCTACPNDWAENVACRESEEILESVERYDKEAQFALDAYDLIHPEDFLSFLSGGNKVVAKREPPEGMKDMTMEGLDRHITGNWGEDSVPPEFVKARELADFETGAEIVLDAAPQTDEKAIPVTVTNVAITSGMVYVATKELAWPLVIPEDDRVYFAEE